MKGVSESQELRLLRTAFSSCPGSDAFVPLAEHLCDLGRPEEAEQVCHRGLATMPADHKGHMVLARALCDRGRLKEAQDVLAELAKHRPDDAEVWVQLGAVVVRRGDRSRACVLLDYAESLGATGRVFEAARQLARKAASHEVRPNLLPAVKIGGRDTPLGPDDRPPPVSGVLVARSVAAHEATQVVQRRRSAPLALAAAALLTLILVSWLLLRG